MNGKQIIKESRWVMNSGKGRIINQLRAFFLVIMLMNGMASTGDAQVIPPFDSLSNGSDGALNITAPGTYIFDPKDTNLFPKEPDSDGDGVFHFTTITIGPQVILRFRGDRYNRPVFWLASGAVVIAGTLDLKGDDEVRVSYDDADARRKVAIPGSGGFPGGAGGNVRGGDSYPATVGGGPGGGSTSGTPNCQNIPTWVCGVGGTLGGTNRYLVPLIGGSGGGGATSNSTNSGAFEVFNGAAGGGAILISSSISINISRIDARGGMVGPSYAGLGSGGAIRLIAPTIATDAAGRLDVTGGAAISGGPSRQGGNGRVRLEAFQFSIGGNLTTAPSTMVQPPSAASSGFASNLYLPVSSVRILSIDGQQVGITPSGSFFRAPDVTINKMVPVAVVIQATGIPPSTPIKLEVFSDNPEDPLTVTKAYDGALDNNLQSTINVPFPAGLSRCYIRVTWVTQ